MGLGVWERGEWRGADGDAGVWVVGKVRKWCV